MKILDATCGQRGIWYQKNHPYVTFMDKREGIFNSKTLNQSFKNSRIIKIKPDVVSDWKNTPFNDEEFDMIIFDPPFIIRKDGNTPNTFVVTYSYLPKNRWEQELKLGIIEFFRILKKDGIFIFKWDEVDIKLKRVLKLFPYPPLFGSRVGQKNNMHWIVFIKYNVNKKLGIKDVRT